MKLTKDLVYSESMRLIKERSDQLHNQITDLSNDADIKSTSGDKHETSRAMMHLQQEQLTTQLGDARNMLNKLAMLRDVNISNFISEGCLITTDKAIFYLAIAQGKIVVANETVYVLSANSPLGKNFIGKSMGDSVSVNGMTYKIVSVQ